MRASAPMWSMWAWVSRICFVFAQPLFNAFRGAARVDHQRLVARLVADDGAVATQHSYGKALQNHVSIVEGFPAEIPARC
jgi:hypothetical protein